MAKKSNTQAPVLLGTPAVRQILARLSKSEKEENALVQKVKIMHINWEISQYIIFYIFLLLSINRYFTKFRLKPAVRSLIIEERDH